MLADGHGPGAVQKQANIEYRLLDGAENTARKNGFTTVAKS